MTRSEPTCCSAPTGASPMSFLMTVLSQPKRATGRGPGRSPCCPPQRP
ncbi:hypothetical protein DUI70_0850 [Streptomyces albus]|nr:hypothetical protein DUI70_0850 [Streptomyces albus]